MSLSTKRLRGMMSAMFAAGMLAGVAGTGIAATALGSSIFPDVNGGSFYDSAIGDMYNRGIIKGYDNGNFGPDDAVTRGQLAVMLQRFRDDLTGGGTVITKSSSSRSSSSAASSAASHTPYGSIRFTAGTYSVEENAGEAKILVVRTGGAQGTVTVSYATSNGTGVAGTDYTTTSGVLTFGNKETSKSFTIPITNNPLPQGNKTFTITLSNPTANSNITTPDTATVTILDGQTSTSSVSSGGASSSSSSNPAGTIGLSATVYGVNEKSGTLNVTINREGGSTGAVGVSYGTSNGTATSGSEYSGVSGTLSFAGGETTKTVTIPIINNSAVTGNKTFNIVIGTVTGGATLGTTTASVTIYDNETGTFGSGTVKVVKDTYNVSKSAGYVEIGVQRTGGASGTVSVNYSTTPLTATAGIDYISTSGTVTFAPGEATKLVRVPVIKTTDSANSGKTFSFDLSGVSSSATLGSPASASVVIDN